MISMLVPGDVAEHWPEFIRMTEGNLPPTSIGDNALLNILLEKILSGAAQLWLLEEGDLKVYAITMIKFDDIYMVKNLWIYGLTDFDTFDQPKFLEGLEAIKTYARTNKCNNVFSFSNDRSMIALAKSLGADVSWRILNWRLT